MASPGGEEEVAEDPELMAIEEKLTKDVPLLLDAMNRTSCDVNDAERALNEATARHRRLLEQLSRSHEEAKNHYGTLIDRARPYFDAAEQLSSASASVQRAVREFSAASTQQEKAKAELRDIEEKLAYGAHKTALDSWQQDGLSKATVRIMRCQNERDARERDYAKALREYEAAQEEAERVRQQVGDLTIRKVTPCFRRLQQQQNTMAAEQNKINALSERRKSLRAKYNGALKELDRINMAVHEARKQHAASKEAGAGAPETEVPRGGEPSPEDAQQASCSSKSVEHVSDDPKSPAECAPEEAVVEKPDSGPLKFEPPARSEKTPGSADAGSKEDDGPFA